MKSRSENKFAVILQGHDVAGAEPTAVSPAQPRAVAPVTATAKRTGRTPGKGKSSDPSFRQVTAYIPLNLHNNATIALRLANQIRIDADKEDFSELLTRLLADWYQGQTFYRPGK
ncbi:MAG: hypothetical protein P4N60_19760 [Verrucomicrobiae bacterium]|nr:hypothetical protein [Verrucomicrobiae bacterium]